MEQTRVIRSAGTVGLLTGVSRVLGLARDVLMAGAFGTSLAMSAFVVAFRIPNLFRALFGEGALSAAFVPVFVESLQREGRESAWRLARRVFTLVAVVLTVLVLAGWIGTTAALAWPGLPPKADAVLSLTRIMLPYMVFICLAAVSMGALNAFHRFAVPAAAPSLLNLTIIAAVLLVCPRMDPAPEARIYAVAWAVLVAGALQWLVQVPPMIRLGFTPRPLAGWRDRKLVRVLALMGPAAVGRAVTQFNVLVDSLLAIWIGTWAPAALFYSERLIYLPLGLFATALGTVLLPVFSGQAASDDHAALRRTVNHSLRLLLFVMIPAAAGLLALGGPIVTFLFQWRRFTPESALLTTRSLMFYAPGLVVFSLAKVFVPAFYALQDTKTPVRVALFTVTGNIILSVVFMLTWPLYFKHAGIAFATVLAETAYAMTLGRLLHRRLGSPGWRAIGASAARALVAATAMAWTAYGTCRWLGARLDLAGWPDKIAQGTALAAALALAAAVFLLLTALLRAPELGELRDALRRKRSQ